MKRTTTVWIFGIIAALIWIPAAQLLALPAHEVETVYCSDGTSTQDVGYVC